MNKQIYEAVTAAFDGTMMSDNVIRHIADDMEQKMKLSTDDIFNVLLNHFVIQNDEQFKDFNEIAKKINQKLLEQKVIQKVWLVGYKWRDETDEGLLTKLFASEKDAKKYFKNKVKEIKKYSWVSEYQNDELDEFVDKETMFHANYAEMLVATIYIEEKEMLN